MNVRTIALAVLALVLVGAVSIAVTIATIAHNVNQTVADQAAAAPEIFSVYRARHGTLQDAMPDIAQHLQRTGLFVFVVDLKTHVAYGEDGQLIRRRAVPGPGGVQPPFQRGHGPEGFGSATLFVASAIGARAWRIPVDGAEIFISPDIAPIVDVFRLVVFAFSAFFLIVGVSLWWYARGLRRQALHAVIETTASLRRLAQRDFTPRTIVTGDRREYGELARAYNEAGAAVAAAFAERQAAEREMQRFIADAGHELRTPLTIVMGYVDVLDGRALTDRSIADRVFSGMRTEARRMRRLIDKLIVLARMETPQGDEPLGEVDVAELAARIAESFETFGGKPIRIEGPRHAFVHADEGEVDEALTNIIENALKYAPESDVYVTIVPAADTVTVTIEDQGPGMTTEERRNAFERFYRGERRGEVAGSGLGLSIAKRALERCGGTLTLRSSIGTGTTLRISLPSTELKRFASPTHELLL
ncbi:MAG: HAMP domain-containing sensor histidine kinase [Candidatus Velthaea sp.]